MVLIVYKFDGIAEHSVLTRPHGNAKTNLTDKQGRAQRIYYAKIRAGTQPLLLMQYLRSVEALYRLKVLVSCPEDDPKPTV